MNHDPSAPFAEYVEQWRQELIAMGIKLFDSCEHGRTYGCEICNPFPKE